MRAGFKVYDSDTHVEPCTEVLDRYVDPSFKARLPELAQYKVIASRPIEGEPERHAYRIGMVRYKRILGQAEPDPAYTGGSGGGWRGAGRPRPGVNDDNPHNRIKDMDEEGVDVNFMFPGSWTSVTALDVELEMGLFKSYHRYMADYCSEFPDRLQSLLLVSGRDVEGSIDEIRHWGKSKWAAGIMPFPGPDTPLDHPVMDPIWAAAEEHDLAVLQHCFTWTPPFYPGYQDMWDNVFLGRLAAHPWAGMRFTAAFVGSGIMDRFPSLRAGVLEAGCSWLPFWSRRMDAQADYVGSTAELKHKCSEYLTNDRFFCSILTQEGEDVVKFVNDFLGDGVLMYASDYPHPECEFPDTTDNVLGWSSLGEESMRKLMWDTATKLYKQS